MKALLFLSFLILATQAYADLPRIEGAYSFQGQIEVLTSWKEEVVNVTGSAGRKRLQDLRKQSYECSPRINQNFLCKKFIQMTLPEDVKKRIIQQYRSQLKVEFGPDQSPPSLLHEGDNYKEWQIKKTVKFKGHEYQSMRFFQGADVRKINLVDDEKSLFESLVFRTSDLFSYIDRFNKTENKIINVFIVELLLSPSVNSGGI